MSIPGRTPTLEDVIASESSYSYRNQYQEELNQFPGRTVTPPGRIVIHIGVGNSELCILDFLLLDITRPFKESLSGKA